MHILVTTDTLSGVWTYTRELATGLVSQGIRVTLVSFGEIPLPQETAWMDRLHGLHYIPTAFRLDWMQEGEQDLKDSRAYLAALVKELKPDVLHLNQMCYGDLPVDIPRVVFAHGDLISWSKCVHGYEPKESRWSRWYQDAISTGLSKASVVVAPTVWMLDSIRTSYLCPEYDTVIYSGRNPIFFNPYVSKDESVLAVGRLWDAGKQVSLLTQHKHPVPVCIVDSDAPAHAIGVPIRADVKLSLGEVRVSLKGPQTEAQLRLLYSRASIYAATARYEPLGMATLEAAFSRCAIVANDIPPFREMWDDTAIYFNANDATSLAVAIRKLSEQRGLCQALGNRAFQRAKECFTAQRMLDDYLRLYRDLISQRVSTAA
ncbi:MAG TPA: glycosyltransferase family 4 protein [Terriglobales bacterium]|nr:glycosyltransferase family 4 protein [Terriglobales bacterium]